MKPHAFTLALALTLGLALLAGTAISDENEKDEVAAARERLAKLTMPGARHDAMRFFLGDWDVEIQLRMPGAPVQSSKGASTFAWLIDGRWLSERITGSFMGQPYEGFAIRGYDNYAKNYVTCAVSNFDTAMNVVRGVVSDPSGKTIVQYGTLDEYMLGDKNHPLKTVTRITGDDTFELEVWDLGLGVEGAVVLKYVYSRRK